MNHTLADIESAHIEALFMNLPLATGILPVKPDIAQRLEKKL
jgi:hypothetical protein